MENAEKENIKSKRDLLKERLAGKYPDKNFDDDDVLYGQISDDYDDYDGRLQGYADREKQLTDMFSSDPRSAAFLMAWKDGEHPMTALVRQFGKDGLQELVENEDKMEEFAKANEEYLERVAKEKELEEEYYANLDASLQTIDEKQKAENLTDEQVDKALGWLVGIVRDGIKGKFSPESIDMAFKAINHDEDVAVAAEEAEIRGKNAKIDEKLRKREAGDGTAALAGSNNGTVPQQREDIFSLAAGAR